MCVWIIEFVFKAAETALKAKLSANAQLDEQSKCVALAGKQMPVQSLMYFHVFLASFALLLLLFSLWFQRGLFYNLNLMAIRNYKKQIYEATNMLPKLASTDSYEAIRQMESPPHVPLKKKKTEKRERHRGRDREM